MKYLCLLIAALLLVNGYCDERDGIKVNNIVLTKINGETISVVDIKKRLDVLFFKNFSKYAESIPARYQFYKASWKHVLDEVINAELMIADSAKKEVKLSDGQIREEMEQRFGPNIMVTLEKLGLSYDEAWKMVKKDLIVKSMSWYFINSKAVSAVTPDKIRQAYKEYCLKNPSTEEWQYRIISIALPLSAQDGPAIAEQVKVVLAANDFDSKIKELEKAKNCSIQITPFYTLNSKEISEKHKSIIANLKQGEYSQPIIQESKEKRSYRLFQLKEYNKKDPPTFESIATKLKEDMLQEEAGAIAQRYFDKLRQQQGFDEKELKATLGDFEPFSIQ